MDNNILRYDTVSMDEVTGELVIIDQTRLPGETVLLKVWSKKGMWNLSILKAVIKLKSKSKAKRDMNIMHIFLHALNLQKTWQNGKMARLTH